MNTNKLLLATAIATALAACGGGGSKHHAISSSSGTAVDGYLSDSTVTCDANDNGIAESGEAFVITEADGKFKFSPACSHDLLVKGGINHVSPGVEYPFLGELKAPKGSTVVTPLTTLMAESGLTSEELVTLLGLPAGTDITKLDPAEEDPANPGQLKNLALSKATLAVVQIIQSLATAYGATPGDTSAFAKVAKNLATQLKDPSAVPLFKTDGTVDSSAITNLVDATITAVNADPTTTAQLSPADANAATTAIKDNAAAILDPTTDSSGLVDIIKDPKISDPTTPPGDVTTADDAYLSLAGDNFAINSADINYTEFTSTAGATTPQITTIDFDFGLSTTLPKIDNTVNIAFSLNQLVGGSRIFEVLITDVKMSNVVSNNATDILTVTVPDTAKAYIYGHTASNVDLYATLGSLQDAGILTVANNTVSLDYDAIISAVTAKNPDFGGLNASITGKFATKMVVSNLNFRKADGKAYPTYTAGVTTDGKTAPVPSITGYGWSGTLNIQ